MNKLPESIEEMFENTPENYRYFSYESMDNFWSMDWFIKNFELQDFVYINDGTQIILEHPDYEFKLQVDAGGLGDFYSHSFNTQKI